MGPVLEKERKTEKQIDTWIFNQCQTVTHAPMLYHAHPCGSFYPWLGSLTQFRVHLAMGASEAPLKVVADLKDSNAPEVAIATSEMTRAEWARIIRFIGRELASAGFEWEASSN